MNKWRKQHPERPDSGMSGATAEQVTGNERLKAQLRETRVEINFLKSGSLLHVGVPVRTRYAYTPPRRRQLPDPSDVPLPGGAVLRLLRRRNRSTLETQKRREGVVIFVRYFFNEPRTNLRVSAGPQSPWNAMALQPARGRYAGSCGRKASDGVSTPPQGP